MERCILQGSFKTVLQSSWNVCEKMLISEVCLGVKWQDLHSIQKKKKKKNPLNHYKKVFVTRDRCVKMLLRKDSVSLQFAYFSGSEGWPYGRHWKKNFWNYCCRILENVFFLAFLGILEFYWEFWGNFN